MPLCLYFNMHALAGPDNFRNIFNVAMNSEASRVSFPNQTLLQIENYMKNGQSSSFQCNV